jgi:glycosyltransferase involved in cell wall biosynthesis
MKLIVFSSAPIIQLKGKLFMYTPYEKEMQIWAKYADEIQFCCPVWIEDRNLLISEINFSPSTVISLSEFSIRNIKLAFFSITKVLKNVFIIFKAIRQADHIHLRCPGNMGLLACIVQIFFPSKPKTAKYAGNWDSKSKQPWSYRLQKRILSNTFLTRNIKLLVYGEWENQSKNIKSFFTATYSETEKAVIQKTINPNAKIKLMFVGSLVEGKNPMYAIQLLEQLRQTNPNVILDIYGDGILRASLEKYIETNNLSHHIILHGNQNQEVLKKAYQESHFVVLPSKSEGWPKAIAEGMFWACVPLGTAVSCVPYMLDQGNRGVLLQMDLHKDAATINNLINNPMGFESKSKAALNWSRQYTLERFENEIQKLLQA